MERSYFGSAIKTYPSKRNRASSYRQSCVVFKDDDPFDQLIEDEQNKKPLTLKKYGFEKGAGRSTKSYIPSGNNAPALRTIQNYTCINRKSSILPHTRKKKVRTKILKGNKENALKCSSRLFKSNSDSDNDLKGLSAYDLSPSVNPLADYKKRRAFQRTKPKPKSRPLSVANDINADRCLLAKETITSKAPDPVIAINHTNSDAERDETVFKKPTAFVERSSDLFYKNSINKNRGQTKTRKILLFNDNHSLDNEYDADNSFENYTSQRAIDELFNCDYETQNEYRCSEVFNPGTASTPNFDRRKLPFSQTFEENEAEDRKWVKSLENTPRSPLLNLSSNSINSVSLNQKEACNRSVHLTTDECHGISNNSKNEKVAEQLDCLSNSAVESSCRNDSISPAMHSDSGKEQAGVEIVKNESAVKTSDSLLNCSLRPLSENSEHLHLNTFNQRDTDNSLTTDHSDKEHSDAETISRNDSAEKPTDFASQTSIDSLSDASTSLDHDSSANLITSSQRLNNSIESKYPQNEQPELIVVLQHRSPVESQTSASPTSSHTVFNDSKSSDNFNDSSPRLNRRSSPPSIVSPISPDSSDRRITLLRMFEEIVDDCTENVAELTNQLHSCSLEDKQNSSKVESGSNIDCPSTSTQFQKSTNGVSITNVTVEPDMKNDASVKENTTVLTQEIIPNFSSMNITVETEVIQPSLSEIFKCLSPIHVLTENILDDDKFVGWSCEEYLQILELRDAFVNLCKEPETKQVQSEEEIPAHLKHVTRRRKKTMVMPTLNEENSNLEDDEVDLCSETRNNPLRSQYTQQICSQNQTSLYVSRFLERSSMMSHSIVLAAGKKWRRSFITLKNIREYGFQSQAEHEDLKGRCWRKNVEELISNQLDENTDLKEISESSTLRSDSNETFLNPNSTCLERCKRPDKARFSFCVNQKSPLPQQQADESSRLTSSSETSKLFSDKSYTSFVGSQHDSRIENKYDLEAGDYSRPFKVSLDCYDLRDYRSSKEKVLQYCKQTQPLPFDECLNDRLLENCKKIGEGVYGEVFMLKRNRAHCSVLKIIPIEGDLLVNGEKQKKFEEILSELVISIELSDLKKRTDYCTDNFAELQKCWCVYGEYPKRLIDLWDVYNDKKGSDNDSPKVFDNEQLYIILELSHGGEDVESFVFNNAQQALSVFTQVAYALAVAEAAFQFEHRDLHWGNILVSKSKEERTLYKIGEFQNSVKLCGVKVTIIDYTLSRISINNCIVFNDIGQDPDLFTAHGDFQFEVYRLMRNEVRNIWNQFAPKTNVYWLCYLLDKMVKEVRYRRISTQIHRKNFKLLEELTESVKEFASCHELIYHFNCKRTISTIR
ncbi:uncharacterized protein LOC135832627 [Planococcus citri]|uniref:uncharacterized protein LOC135832627 n=1 Tax=Planococcus citri TaxID=170843 RepID=UPI0031FA23A3